MKFRLIDLRSLRSDWVQRAKVNPDCNPVGCRTGGLPFFHHEHSRASDLRGAAPGESIAFHPCQTVPVIAPARRTPGQELNVTR